MKQQIPASPQTERALLGTLIEDPTAYDEVEGQLEPAMFFESEHAGIFEAIQRVRKTKREIGVLTVMEALDATGNGALVETMMGIVHNFLRYHDIRDLIAKVRSVHYRRESIRVCMELAARGHDPSVDDLEFAADLETRIAALVNANHTNKDSFRKLDPQAAYDAIVETIQNKGKANLSTSLRELDALTSGLGNGQVMVVGAEPGMGKTGLAVSILEETAMNRKKPAAFFSLEMPESEIAQRLISRKSNVCLAQMRSGKLTAQDIEKMNPAMEAVGTAQIYIYDTPEPTIAKMRAEARRLKARVGELGVVVIDYLQLAKGTTKTEVREQEIAEISRGTKAMAKELGCPVVSLAQLNDGPSKRPNRRPHASDLRESRAIWQDADTIVLLFNPHLDAIEKGAHDTGERVAILAKNRHGPKGEVVCHFDKPSASFVDAPSIIVPWPPTTKRPPVTSGEYPMEDDGINDDERRYGR